MALKITKIAEEKLQTYVTENPGFLPKIAVVSGGCSGFKYVVGLDRPSDGDREIKLESGFTVLVNGDSVNLLDGVTLDYKTSLMSEGFYFENPSASSCGCGSSFRPKDVEECD